MDFFLKSIVGDENNKASTHLTQYRSSHWRWWTGGAVPARVWMSWATGTLLARR